VVEGWNQRPQRVGRPARGEAIPAEEGGPRAVGVLAVAGIPPATRQRRVFPAPDPGAAAAGGYPDGCRKTVLDALLYAGLMLEDKRQGVEPGDVSFLRGPARRAEMVLEHMRQDYGPGSRSGEDDGARGQTPDVKRHIARLSVAPRAGRVMIKYTA
jgi:hypothetical protein